ncbi:MAG: DUF4265 domain-containing protein [Zoogloeaceae bacterium]|jgi:hypothetical protein|nr:DUF4265 domain-containing protein [Zoogloeaceae bacterium]
MSNETDNLVKVHIDLPNHWWFKGESLWAKPLGDDLYEIQNVPFCAYGLNCGDVVFAKANSPDLKPEIRSVVRRSGQKTLRVFFGDELSEKEEQKPYIEEIERMDAWVERAHSTVICINVNATGDYAAICTYLESLENSVGVEFETCEERIPGSFDDLPESEDGDSV